MLIKTKYFGEVDLDEKKVITFDNGMMGFEEYKKFAILYDIEKERENSISWLQLLCLSYHKFPVLSYIPDYLQLLDILFL